MSTYSQPETGPNSHTGLHADFQDMLEGHVVGLAKILHFLLSKIMHGPWAYERFGHVPFFIVQQRALTVLGSTSSRVGRSANLG